MALDNQFLDETVYAKTMLYLIKNRLVMGRLVDTRYTNQVTDQNGLTINVKRPPRFVQTDGPTLQAQSVVTGSTNISVNQYKGVHIQITDLQYVQSFNQLMRSQSMKSAASTLAHGVDSYLQGFLKKFPSWVQAPGATAVDTALQSPNQFVPVWSRLENLSVPGDDRVAVLSTEDAEGVMETLIDNNSMSDVARSAMEQARIPMLSAVRPYHTQGTTSLTTGTRAQAGAAQVNGASQNVNYADVKDTMVQPLILESAGNAVTFAVGDVFTIPGVYAINQRTQETLPYLQQFTVTTAATSSAGGAVTLTISPPIIVPGTGADTEQQRVNTAFATVNSVPANDAVVVFSGNPSSTFKQRAAWHRSAIQLVSARLITPMTGVSSFATDPETGISIRYWRGSDITTGNHVHRWDMIYGGEVLDPLLGTRFSGVSS